MSLQSFKRRLKSHKRVLQLYALLWQWRTSSYSAERRLRLAKRLASGDLSVVSTRAFRAAIRPEHKTIPLLPEEEVMKAAALQNLEQQQGLFMAALYCKPHDLPFERLTAGLVAVEDRLRDTAYAYAFDIYHLYDALGEADRHERYIQQALGFVLSSNDPQIKAAFERHVTTAPITNGASMKTLFILRAQLLKNPSIPAFTPKERRPIKRIGLVRHNYRGEINYFLPIFAHFTDCELHMLVFNDDGRDDIEKRFPHLVHHVLDEGDMVGAVEHARGLDLDMAINTTYMSGNFANPVAALLNERIAPIQLNACGDVTTSGMKEIDRFLLGERYIHSAIEQEFTEEILPSSGIGFYMPPPPSLQFDRTKERAAIGLSDRDVVFASNAHMFKLNPEPIHAWMDILARVPQAKLLLMPYNCTYRKARFGPMFKRMLDSARSLYGVDEDHIVIWDAQGKHAVMAGLAAADVYLDVFPYAGPTSTIEALAVGLPAVTLRGPTYRHCLTTGMLEEMDLSNFIASDLESYKGRAIQLASDKTDWRPLLKRALQAPSFFDTAAIARDYKRAFTNLFKNTQKAA